MILKRILKISLLVVCALVTIASAITIANAAQTPLDNWNFRSVFNITGVKNLSATSICFGSDCKTAWADIAGTQNITSSPNFVVTEIGSTYYAFNRTGNVVYSGTDAGSVINSALDDSSVANYVQLTEGTFNSNTTILMDVTGMRLSGVGMNRTVIRQMSGGNQNVINMTGTDVRFLYLSDMTIDGNDNGNSAGMGIYMSTPYSSGDTHHVLKNLEIQRTEEECMVIAGDTRVVIQEGLLRCFLASDVGFDIGGTDHSFLGSVVVENVDQHGIILRAPSSSYQYIKVFGSGNSGNSYYGVYLTGGYQKINYLELQDNEYRGLGNDNSGADQVDIDTLVLQNNGRSSASLGFDLWNTHHWIIHTLFAWNTGTYQTYPGRTWGGTSNIRIDDIYSWGHTTSNYINSWNTSANMSVGYNMSV